MASKNRCIVCPHDVYADIYDDANTYLWRVECIWRVQIHVQTYIHVRYEGYLRKNYHKKPQPVSYNNRCEERNLSLLSLCEVHFCLNM